MPRSMWRGAVSFGMVAIPIRMYLATESHSVSFRLLCPGCHQPIRNRRWCENESKEVGWNEVIRGYEVAKGEFVEIDDSDLERVPLPTSQAIEILEFVEDSSIDAAVFLKQAYYLEPEQVGLKPYELLRQALDRTSRVAIGRLALRDREHLVRLAPHGDHGLVLNTLHWPDEIRATAELRQPGDDVNVSKNELDMAVMLIENLATEFDPARHRDRYREALLEVVEEKLGRREVARPAQAEPVPVMDLMAALKASLDQARARPTAAAEDDEAVPKVVGAATATAARRARSAEPRSESARRRKAS